MRKRIRQEAMEGLEMLATAVEVSTVVSRTFNRRGQKKGKGEKRGSNPAVLTSISDQTREAPSNGSCRDVDAQPLCDLVFPVPGWTKERMLRRSRRNVSIERPIQRYKESKTSPVGIVQRNGRPCQRLSYSDPESTDVHARWILSGGQAAGGDAPDQGA